MILFLHIGLHKTGSTALQLAMHRRRAQLARGGVFYFSGGSSGASNHSAFMRQAYNPWQDGEKGREAFFARNPKLPKDGATLRAELLSEAREAARTPGAKFVISGEVMAGALDRAALERLREDFAGIAEEIRVVVYVREPVSYAASMVQQTVKGGRPLRELMDVPPLPHFRARISKFGAAFGRRAVDIRVFDRARLAGGDIVADFWDAIGGEGPPPLPGSPEEEINVSLGHLAVHVLSEAHEGARAGRLHRGLAPNLVRMLASVGGGRYALPPEVARRVREACAEDLAWLEERLGRPPFPEAGPDPAPPPVDETALPGLAALLNELAWRRRDARGGGDGLLGAAARIAPGLASRLRER